MKKRVFALMTFLIILALTACTAGASLTTTGSNTTQGAITAASAGTSSGSSADTNNISTSAAAAGNIGSASTTEAATVDRQTHEDVDDYVYDLSTAVTILLTGNSISTQGTGVVVDGSTATITAAGTYQISGSLDDGQIVVDTKDKAVVRLILDGVNIHSSSSAPIYVADAKKVVIVLANQTENTLSDGETYVFSVPEEEEPNAAIFSKSELTITGSGALTVNGNFRDGINSKDGLIIASGNITIHAADDGIRGKDYLVVKDGSLTVYAQGDGLKSDHEEDTTMGYISFTAGTIQVTAGGDAINARTDVLISGGTFDLSSGGGSGSRANEATSAKGIKGSASVTIDEGIFSIQSADDTIHSNGSVTINGGVFSLASADDGIHADETLMINGGDIRVTQSYEGLESAVIIMNGGIIHVSASDDGVNVAGGIDGSGMGMGMRPGGFSGQAGPGQDAFAYAGDYYLYINGGYLFVDAYGDGIDVNGAIEMTGGVVIVNGPTEQMNGAVDYDGGFKLTGGLFVAVGSSGMAQAPDTSSSQPSVLANLSAAQPAGTLIHIQNQAGETLLSFAPSKTYQSVAFSSPDLMQGASYTIYTSGSESGIAADGLYQGGTYTPGSRVASFTVSSTVTMLGTAGGMRGGRRP